MTSNEFVTRIIEALESKDALKVAALMTNDATLRFGNKPAVHGHETIIQFYATIFDLLISCKYDDTIVEEGANFILWQGVSTYHRNDGVVVTFPFCSVIRKEGDKMKEFLTYADNSALFSPIHVVRSVDHP